MKWVETFAKQKDGIREYIPLLYSVIFFLVFTQFDMGMVEWVLKEGGALNKVEVYWRLTYQLLIPFLIILITAALQDVRFATYTITFIYTGWLDIYYYVFLGHRMPYWLPWMWGPLEPNRPTVFAVGIAFLILSFLLDYGIRVLRKTGQPTFLQQL